MTSQNKLFEEHYVIMCLASNEGRKQKDTIPHKVLLSIINYWYLILELKFLLLLTIKATEVRYCVVVAGNLKHSKGFSAASASFPPKAGRRNGFKNHKGVCLG